MVHGLTVLVCCTLMVCAVMVGRAVGDRARRRLRMALVALGLLVWAAAQVFYLSPAQFDAIKSLPLHICDLAGLLAPLTLLLQHRPMRALLYFWAFALSTQAFFTPVVQVGPDHVEFWVFWSLHTVIVGFAVYDVAVERYRPAWGDFVFAWWATFGYVVAVFLINWPTGWNYGYVGNVVNERPTLVDHLGPWPWRVPVLMAIATVAYLLVWLPWPLLGRWNRPQ